MSKRTSHSFTSQRASRPSAGFTLIEMLVVFMLATGMAFMAIRMLEVVSVVRESTQADVQTFRDLRRLAEQLRQDAHQATQVRSVDDGATVELTSGDAQRHVRYQIADSMIRRVAEDASSDAVTARDGYQLPESSTARWNVDPNGSLVRLQIDSQRSRIPEFFIEAAYAVEEQR